MDLQKLINNMSEQRAIDRANYHLTLGDLIEALKKADPSAMFDKRIKGIGSWRGSYIEIALYTESEGYHAEKEEFNGDYSKEKYDAWEKENIISGTLPKNANELGKVLESLIGLQFVGYKGGNFTIENWKPLWLEEDSSTYNENAIVDIDSNLNLIIKNLREEKQP